MIGKRTRRKRARPPREAILKSVVALARYVRRDHHAAGAAVSASGAGQSIGRLFHYLLDSPSEKDRERVNAGGAFNLFGSKPEAWEAQLVAAADQCPARADPLEHYVLSWPESERPTASQLQASARTLMGELGLGRCPAVWAAHNDTDNLHLHVAVVRFDLETGKVAGFDWDIDRLHQAIAIIEHQHGWKPEKNAVYRVEGVLLCEAQTGEPVRDLKMGKSFDVERRQRLDLQKAAIASQLLFGLNRLKDWDQFHRSAAQFGLRYVRKGSGARVHSRTGSYKASAIHLDLALTKMEAKLGPYEGRRGERGTTYEGYERSYSKCLDHLRAAQAAAREHLDKVRKDERAKLAALLAEANARALLLAFNQAVECEFENARAALDDAYREAKKDLLTRRLDQAAWRAAAEPASIEPVHPPEVLFPAISTSQAVPPASEVASVRHGQEQQAITLHVDHRYESGRVAFTDHRAMLIVRNAERTAICAALELAQHRWGAALVSGSAAFRAQCKSIGAERGINVVDAGEPTPLIRKPKALAPGRPKRPSVSSSFRQPPSPPPLDVTIAREAARARAGLARESRHALEGGAMDVEVSPQPNVARAPAKTGPAEGSLNSPVMHNPSKLSHVEKGIEGATPTDVPIMPPNRGKGWER